jgi:hypothetical protein
MATTVQQIHPVAHLPLVFGVLRRLEVATVIDHLIPPHLAHVLSYGRGVEALVLAILDGHHALSVVALKALEVYAILTPWLHQDTTTIALYGAYEDEPTADPWSAPAYLWA